MSASLVGSEMCIRDRNGRRERRSGEGGGEKEEGESGAAAGDQQYQATVSYTHLTLPTICSV
eukprot:7731584-Alexandrium_andersonii.AAC.1